MRPTAAECGSSGGGSVVGSRAPRAVERRRMLNMEVGLDSGRARRRHRGWSATKRGGAVEAEKEVAQ
jgi:hypothetical protein